MTAYALQGLIREYLAAVAEAVAILRGEMGRTDLLPAVGSMQIPRRGPLHSGGIYEFHGVGCRVSRSEASVDFDFGPNGRTDGFDAWRLSSYARETGKYPEFHSEAVTDAALAELDRAGLVFRPGWQPSPHLYYCVEPQTERT